MEVGRMNMRFAELGRSPKSANGFGIEHQTIPHFHLYQESYMRQPDSFTHNHLMQIICQLHDWENQHLELAHSQAGRYLYLSIVKQLQGKAEGPSALLKGIYYNKDLSERALRYKLREFENQGLIAFEASTTDKRSKRILPTDSLVQTMADHASAFAQLLGKEFLVLPKNKA
jgi:hypothetical protein